MGCQFYPGKNRFIARETMGGAVAPPFAVSNKDENGLKRLKRCVKKYRRGKALMPFHRAPKG
jgi:hypothetical protein